jgi:hypothetical protein
MRTGDMKPDSASKDTAVKHDLRPVSSPIVITVKTRCRSKRYNETKNGTKPATRVDQILFSNTKGTTLHSDKSGLDGQFSVRVLIEEAYYGRPDTGPNQHWPALT